MSTIIHSCLSIRPGRILTDFLSEPHGTFVADIDSRPGDKVLNLIPAFSAKRAAVNGILRVCRCFNLGMFLEVQDDVLANIDAFIADVDPIGTGKEPLYLCVGRGAKIAPHYVRVLKYHNSYIGNCRA